MIQQMLKVKKMNNKVIIAGNGASASIANHVAVDFTKVNHIRSINFNEANLITCLANDFGYENWHVSYTHLTLQTKREV